MGMLCAGGYDLSGVVFSVSCSERVNNAAAQLVFYMPKNMGKKLQNGDEVVFSQGGAKLFCGYVFATEQTEKQVKITALDSLRYLSVMMPLQREEETAGAFVSRAVMTAGGRAAAGIVEDTGVILEKKRFDNVSLLKAIYLSISESERVSGDRLVLRDEGGQICLRKENSLILPLVIGEDSLATGYCHSRSIGDDAVNYVKVTAENKAVGMKIAAIARNDEAIAKWGLISKTVRGEGEPEKLLETARNILTKGCCETERITVSAKGDARVRAGCCLTLELPGENPFLTRVTGSVHNIVGESHIMRLELEKI